MSWPRKSRFRYSVPEPQITAFVNNNDCVRDFLARYEEDNTTYTEKARGLVRFFLWLKTVKNTELSPSEFLDLHLSKRSSNSVEERRKGMSCTHDNNDRCRHIQFALSKPDIKEIVRQKRRTEGWKLPEV